MNSGLAGLGTWSLSMRTTGRAAPRLAPAATRCLEDAAQLSDVVCHLGNSAQTSDSGSCDPTLLVSVVGVTDRVRLSLGYEPHDAGLWQPPRDKPAVLHPWTVLRIGTPRSARLDRQQREHRAVRVTEASRTDPGKRGLRACPRACSRVGSGTARPQGFHRE
jgi:hypothetical protein